MHKRYRHLFLTSSLTLLLFFALLPGTAHAFGVSPATIEVNDILPGSSIQRVVSVSHTTPQISTAYDVAVNGTGAPFIQLSSSEVVIPQGEREVVFPFSIVIPESVTGGAFKADISFIGRMSPQDNTSTGGLILRQGVVISVNFSVTKQQNTTFTIRDIGFEANTSKEPVIFYYRLVNDGNTAAGPDSATVVLTPVGQMGEQKEITIRDLPLVGPKQTEVVRSEILPSLSTGRYAVHVSFFSGDVMEHEEKDRQFLVISPPDGKIYSVVSRLVLFRRFLFISLITTIVIFIFYSYLSYKKRSV